MRQLVPLVLAAAGAVCAGADVCAQTGENQSVGLVLSGGGAKGIAHIGVIQALEDNDVAIDYITGTSMGAIVGGLYSAGYTPQEMLDLLLSPGFSYWSTGTIDPRLTYFFNREEPSPSMFTVPLPGGQKPDSASSVPASVINPLPMNFAFMELFAAYTAQCGGNFDRLFVPFRCVASDVDAKHKVVFRSGSLGDAVRASMSFPIVFQPIKVDGALLYDGGIYDNFPFDVMRSDFAPSIMIGVDVSTPTTGPQTSLMDQIENLVIQSGNYDLPADEGIKLHIDLHQFGLLDFPKAREIYNIGYAHAMNMMDSIKSRVHARTPRLMRDMRRGVFKSSTPYVRFDSVSVAGASPRQNQYISYLFSPRRGEDTIGIERAREAFYRAISSGKLRDLYPQAHYNDSTGLFGLDLRATVKDNLRAGFGGYLTSSSNSYLFVSAGYSTLSFSSVGANINAWLGQSNIAGSINGRMFLHTPVPSSIGVQAVVSREKFYESDQMFYHDRQPTFLIHREYFGRLIWSFATSRLSMTDIAVGGGSMNSSFFRNNHADAYLQGRDKARYHLFQALARFRSSTLNSHNFPLSGNSYEATAMAVMGRYELSAADFPEGSEITHPKWLQLELATRNYPEFGDHFSLGIETDVLLSTRKLVRSYSAAIADAPAFCPTPASYNSFNPALRANSFVAAGLVPVFRYNANLSARVGGYCFMPVRKIEENRADNTALWGKYFSNPTFFGEADVSYHFPFGVLTGYVNYCSEPTGSWNVGLSFGIHLLPPKLLR